MEATIKSLLAKTWKNETAELSPGTHYFDEEMTVRLRGSVEKLADELATPTVSIPLIATLAYFWDRLGVDREEAISVLREALHEAMSKGRKEDEDIKARMDDVKAAVRAVQRDLIADLPKMRRTGKVLVDGLEVEMLEAGVEEELVGV